MTAEITVLRKAHEGPASQTPADETHAERAYRLIEDEIVTLSLEPGVRLTEQELAERVGLGRTPVREAVQRLVSEGLVVVYPRKGMAVAAINPLEILQALDVRAALERVVAVAAARRAAPAERARLLGIARELLEAAKAGDASRYMRLDKAFDEVLGQASGNPFAVRAMAPLQSMARRAWYYFRRERDLEATASRHADVVEAVVEGDEAKAAAASDALVAHVREGLKQALAEL